MPALRELVVHDPAATEIDPRIAPVEGEMVITKKYPSAFFQTHLLSMLIVDRIDSLILTGCSTSGCVRATAVDGVSYGYRVAVPVQAVTDRWPAPHDGSLFDIDAKYGDVISVAEAVEHLRGLPEPLGPSRRRGGRRAMRAVRFHEYGGVDVLRLEDVDVPEPGPGEALVRVRACAVNHVDIDMRNGMSRLPLTLPHTLGFEIAGEVAAVGPDVSEVVGRRPGRPALPDPLPRVRVVRARRAHALRADQHARRAVAGRLRRVRRSRRPGH